MPDWSGLFYKKNVQLEERLAQDKEFDFTGVMNLSAMNLIDHDLPMVIDRAIKKRPKKCIGLILRENDLTGKGVKMLVDALLEVRTNLKYLSLSSNPRIGDAGIEHLIRLLKKNRSITLLALPETGITDRGVRLLADLLCSVDGESSLEKLYISFNKLITDESMKALIQILEENQTLKALSLNHCSLSDANRRLLKQKALITRKKKFTLF